MGAVPAGLFLPVRVLSRRFREVFLARLRAAFMAGELRFSGTLAALAEPSAFAARLAELRGIEWVVFAKRPFAGPEQVLGYLGRYTHRVAIANSRLTADQDGKVSFTWKDYRHHGKTKVMTLEADEFIRRFLQHAVPDGFHRIRHIGFLANSHRTAKLALCRALLAAPPPEPTPVEGYRERTLRLTGHAVDVCPDCGGPMRDRDVLPSPAATSHCVLVRYVMTGWTRSNLTTRSKFAMLASHRQAAAQGWMAYPSNLLDQRRPIVTSRDLPPYIAALADPEPCQGSARSFGPISQMRTRTIQRP
jgi:hypothetical protein